jgi:prepilin-type N-terminal cleavage/methylation domain-containing protein
MKMTISRDINGFTLIEILIATVIITVASLGVASLTVGIIRGTSFDQRLTTAITLAQDRLEESKRLSYKDVGTLAGTENYGTIANFSGYKRVTSVDNNKPALNMKTVTVTVYGASDKQYAKAITILSE